MVTPTPPSGAFGWLARFKGPIVAIAGVGAVLSGLVGWYTTYKTVSSSTTSVSATAPNFDAINPLSILVLPFANQTGDANKAYIADALTSSISADLNRIRDAFVVPTATAFTYKDKNLTVAQVGKDAGVRFVLQGGVVASGDKLRISAQLADTQSGKQLWNETFEGEATNLFELQDLVTTRIGNSIGNEMVIVAARESEKRKSSTKVADLMMRQRALGLKQMSPETFNQREPLLRAVIQQEPDNAEALATLGAVLAAHAVNFLDDKSPRYQPMFTEAKALALRAKAIDDQLPGIYIALAIHANAIDNDSAETRRNYEIALKLAPKSPLSYNNLSQWYHSDGQCKPAIELLNKALTLHPKGSSNIFGSLSRCYLRLGDNAAAIEWGQRAVDIGSTIPGTLAYLAMAHANLGQMDKAAQYANEYKQRMEQLGRTGSIDKLDGSETPTYVKYYNEHYLPEWRKAGLPE
jgi:TolB-like protein/Tfp pilus assembly protein PilF